MDTGTAKPKTRKRESNDTRAERKREIDRLAQRAIRERTKNRIAFLEQKLASLESCDRQGEISNLTKIIDNLRNDNMCLQSAMRKMRFAINEALDGVEGASSQSQDTPRPCGCSCQTNGTSGSPEGDTVRHGAFSSTAESDFIELPPETAQQAPPDISTTQSMMNGMASGMTSLEGFFGSNGAVPVSVMNTIYDMPNPEFMQWQQLTFSPLDYRMRVTGNSEVTVAKDVEKWNVLNRAFAKCMDSVQKGPASNFAPHLHVPCRVAIWGWDSVGEDANHPIWAALRSVDQRVFGSWTYKAQRIALICVYQTLLQYRGNPTKENLARVPKWFRPRPAQDKVQHPVAVDFLIWPGMRDRFVFEHDNYTRTGEFSAAFVNNFNFHWPHTEEAICTFSPTSQTYELSQIFLEYVYDFKNWTMKPDFFRKFPEMQHDVLAYGELE